MDRHVHFINGRSVEGAPAGWFPVTDPSTGKTFAEVADGTEADADAAVAAARAAFDDGPWPRMQPEDRRAVLRRLVTVLSGEAGTILEQMVRDTGCPTRLADMMQVGAPLSFLEDFADQARLLKPRSLPVRDAPTFGHSEVHLVPKGVCAGIVPFNFPLWVAAMKLGPALAMGNTSILKLSPLAPVAGTILARAAAEAGIPPGVLNIVHGDAPVGNRLAESPGVDTISFTGSTAVGRRVAAAAAGTVKDVVLELGGKSPSIILPDADLELAARAACFAGFLHAGQACGAITRLFVPRRRQDEVCDRVAELVGAMVMGPAGEFTTDIGPVISAHQLESIERRVDDAVSAGAKAVSGGRRAALDAGGWYYEPTVLVGVDNSTPIAREEVFGPVVCVLAYDTVDEAVRMANDSDYGLVASVWGEDLQRARDVAARLRVGTVWVNDWGILIADAPFGGFKQSGRGRELGVEGLMPFVEQRHCYTALDSAVDSRPYSLVGLNWD